MASIFKLPLVQGRPQRFTITLGGVVYQMVLTYRNATDGGWFLDIANANGVPILSGIPLVTGADLLAQYAYLGFGGQLWVQTASDPDAVPTFDNLGGDAALYWVPTL